MFNDHWKVTLNQLEGSSVRVSPLIGPPYTWVGLLGVAGDRHVDVDLANAPEMALAGMVVQVHVLNQGGIYHFETTAWSDSLYRYRLQLVLPDMIQAVQRRSYPRIAIADDLAIWTDDGKQIVTRGEGRACNVSIGGLAFDAAFRLPVGSHLFVQFREGVARQLGHLEGQVIRCDHKPEGGWAMAIAFRNLRPKVMGDLFELVQTRLRMEAGFLESAAGSLE